MNQATTIYSCITRLEELETEARAYGYIVLSRKLQSIIDDMNSVVEEIDVKGIS